MNGSWLLWLPLAFLGFPPAMIFVQKGISLIYQFWIHTEAVRRMPAWFEWVFNTPSHHRVHHATNPLYLDRNYAGVFMFWDRLFGTFRPETFRPHYGLTKPVDTFNIWTLETYEYVAIARDVRSATNWRDRLGFIFGPPGWEPAGRGTISVCESRSIKPSTPA